MRRLLFCFCNALRVAQGWMRKEVVLVRERMLLTLRDPNLN